MKLKQDVPCIRLRSARREPFEPLGITMDGHQMEAHIVFLICAAATNMGRLALAFITCELSW